MPFLLEVGIDLIVEQVADIIATACFLTCPFRRSGIKEFLSGAFGHDNDGMLLAL